MHTVQFSSIPFLGFLFSSKRDDSVEAPFALHLSPFHTYIHAYIHSYILHLCKVENSPLFQLCQTCLRQPGLLWMQGDFTSKIKALLILQIRHSSHLSIILISCPMKKIKNYKLSGGTDPSTILPLSLVMNSNSFWSSWHSHVLKEMLFVKYKRKIFI